MIYIYQCQEPTCWILGGDPVALTLPSNPGHSTTMVFRHPHYACIVQKHFHSAANQRVEYQANLHVAPLLSHGGHLDLAQGAVSSKRQMQVRHFIQLLRHVPYRSTMGA